MNTHRGLLHHLIINVSDLKRSAHFYGRIFNYLGYERAHYEHEGFNAFEDWKRWDLDTPHEISICQAENVLEFDREERRGVGRHHHIAFCALDRDDVNRFHREILEPLEILGLCEVEDSPGICPEYGDGYYATFFFDPDGLKYEYVFNPNHLRAKKEREPNAAKPSP